MTMSLPIIEQLLHCTVRIETESTSGLGSGTGFYFNTLEEAGSAVPVIVTNKHVIQGAKRGRIHITLADEQGMPCLGQFQQILMDNFDQAWIPHPDANVDLCVLPINPHMEMLRQQGHRPFYLPLVKGIVAEQPLLEELSVMEELSIIGYPNGLWDHVNNLPIVRKGITATPPAVRYQGQSRFLIDAAIFNGSSGSPVFLTNLGGYTDKRGNTHLGTSRIYLLGIVFAVHLHRATGDIVQVPVPTQMRPVPLTDIPNNLGIVVPAKHLLEFDAILRQTLQINMP